MFSNIDLSGFPQPTVDELPGFHTELAVYYCKDVYSPDYGMLVTRLLYESFATLTWNLGEQYQGETNLDSVLQGLCTSEWQRPSDDSGLIMFSSDDGAVQFEAWLPPAGGVAVRPPNPGHFWFSPCRMSLNYVRERIPPPEVVAGLMRFLPAAAAAVEASYGYVGNCGQMRPWRLDMRLSGVYWLTLFGPEYVEMMGADKFEKLPVYRVDVMPDGTRVVQLTETYEESISQHGEDLRNEIMARLGQKWFTERADDNWYPRLRNLVV